MIPHYHQQPASDDAKAAFARLEALLARLRPVILYGTPQEKRLALGKECSPGIGDLQTIRSDLNGRGKLRRVA